MTRIPLWLDLRHVADDERSAYVAAGRTAGCDVMLGVDAQVEAGRIVQDGVIGAWLELRDGADQEEAAEHPGVVVVACRDWTIIPLENLIAARRDRPGTLFAVASSPEEAGRFREVLEIGIHGIVLRPRSPADIAATDALLRRHGERRDDLAAAHAEVRLAAAKVTAIEDAGPGDRVCIDTTSLFQAGEGLLVGSTARAFALVHAETIETDFVRARPFRVNAGAVHAYVLTPGGKTRYLSELRSGDRILAVRHDGNQRVLTIGRAKIERRPHTLLRWHGPGGDGHLVAQTAETIRFVRPDGNVVAITDLQVGDELLVHSETTARHFGMPVVEHLEER